MVSTQMVVRILKAREERARRHKQLSEIYQGTILALTMNIPGAQKNTTNSMKAFTLGLDLMNKKLSSRRVNVLKHEANVTDDGPEACWVIDTPPISLKEWAMEIEENHPLGRLFDFDVLDENLCPIHREFIGEKRRSCLICGLPAHTCARSQKHSCEDLHKKINHMVNEFIAGYDTPIDYLKDANSKEVNAYAKP